MRVIKKCGACNNKGITKQNFFCKVLKNDFHYLIFNDKVSYYSKKSKFL